MDEFTGIEINSATREGDMSSLYDFHHHRPFLFSIAYRMLGSVTDAEDMVQETFLRWQQTTQATVKSTKTYSGS